METALIPSNGELHWSRLEGHVAVVTGGNSGIGLGLAAGLVDAGASVNIWGRNKSKNARACEALAGGPGAVSAIACDVANEAEVVRAMTQVAEEQGRLDSCFVNAAIGGRRTPLIDTTLEEFRRVSSVNLEGTFVTLREAARHMGRFGNGGSLVVTSSMGTRFGMPRGYAYASAKAAMIAMAQACAVELAHDRIRANALLPGWTETGMTIDTAFADERFVEAVLPRMPINRWGVPADFAAIAVYLASSASAFHTGDALLLDGGYSAF
jgi:NAD(P)-dependent dehydrogenase (short-subunit alcohol dehydrogenase family)